ncbi:MAG: hypothetical protein ACREQW_22435 [Candidatus Binatia bacterium]
MKWLRQGMLVLIVCFLSAEYLPGQAIVEYGKGLERVNPPTGGMKAPGRARRGGGGSQGPGVDIPPIILPTALTVKEDETQVYAQQDEYSARVEKARKGATLTPMGQTTVNGEKWYMVRSQEGAVGWIKAAMVEETWPAKSGKTAKETQQATKIK